MKNQHLTLKTDKNTELNRQLKQLKQTVHKQLRVWTHFQYAHEKKCEPAFILNRIPAVT